MKSQIFLSLLVFTFFFSCKKDSINTETVNESPRNVERLILDFKARLDATLKEGTTYAADSAVWYVEALLNYEMANNAHNFAELKFYRDSILLNGANGEFAIEELNAAYSYFNSLIAGILEQSEYPSLHTDFVHISLKETGLKTFSNVLEITVCTGISTPINYELFGEDEDWYWGYNLGACGDNQSPEVTDAAKKLEYKFNRPLSVGPSGYFTSIENIEVDGDAYYDENNPGPWCNAMIFNYQPLQAPPDDPCLESEELDYYLSKFDFIKNDNKPSGKDFKSVDVFEDIIPNMGVPNYFHKYKLFYGVLSENPE
jgi:hypothetical protein